MYVLYEREILYQIFSHDMVKINDKNIIMDEPACCWNGWRFCYRQCKKIGWDQQGFEQEKGSNIEE